MDPAVAANPQPYYREARGGWRGRRRHLGPPGRAAGRPCEYVLQHPEEFSSAMEAVDLGQSVPLIPLQVDPPSHRNYRRLLDPIFAPRQMNAARAGHHPDGQRADRQLHRPGRVRVRRRAGRPAARRRCSCGWSVSPCPSSTCSSSMKDGILRPTGDDMDEIQASQKVAAQQIEAYFAEVSDRGAHAEAPGRHPQPVPRRRDRRAAADRGRDRRDLLPVHPGRAGHGDRQPRVLLRLPGPASRRNAGGSWTIPSIIPSAVEELLRWETPVTTVARTATADIELDGCPIHKGTNVGVASARPTSTRQALPDAFTVDLDPQPQQAPGLRRGRPPVPRIPSGSDGAAHRPARVAPADPRLLDRPRAPSSSTSSGSARSTSCRWSSPRPVHEGRTGVDFAAHRRPAAPPGDDPQVPREHRPDWRRSAAWPTTSRPASTRDLVAAGRRARLDLDARPRGARGRQRLGSRPARPGAGGRGDGHGWSRPARWPPDQRGGRGPGPTRDPALSVTRRSSRPCQRHVVGRLVPGRAGRRPRPGTGGHGHGDGRGRRLRARRRHRARRGGRPGRPAAGDRHGRRRPRAPLRGAGRRPGGERRPPPTASTWSGGSPRSASTGWSGPARRCVGDQGRLPTTSSASCRRPSCSSARRWSGPSTGSSSSPSSTPSTGTPSAGPLASYQALKHRFADMKLWLEACHATADAAARAVDAGLGQCRRAGQRGQGLHRGAGARHHPGLRAAARRHRRHLGPRHPPLPAPGGRRPVAAGDAARPPRAGGRHHGDAEEASMSDRRAAAWTPMSRPDPRTSSRSADGPATGWPKNMPLLPRARPTPCWPARTRRASEARSAAAHAVRRWLRRHLLSAGVRRPGAWPCPPAGLHPGERCPTEMPTSFNVPTFSILAADPARLRHRGAEAAAHPGHPPGRRDVGAVPLRAERWFRPGRARHPGDPGRRRVRPQRVEDLEHGRFTSPTTPCAWPGPTGRCPSTVA